VGTVGRSIMPTRLVPTNDAFYFVATELFNWQKAKKERQRRKG
jgi:hypothetical protein